MLNEIKAKLTMAIEKFMEPELEVASDLDVKETLFDDKVNDKFRRSNTNDKFVHLERVPLVPIYPQPVPVLPLIPYDDSVGSSDGVDDSESSDEGTSTPPSDTKNKQQELESTLSAWLKSIEECNQGKSTNKSYIDEVNETILTKEELIKNLNDMLNSDNPEIAGIAKEIMNLFQKFGLDLTMINDLLSKSWLTNAKESLYNTSSLDIMKIVLNALFSALGYVEQANGVKANNVDYGISLDQLLGLDANGDGSIVDELQAKLSDPAFLANIQKQIDIDKNKSQIELEVYETIDDINDNFLTVGEIANHFKDSELARFFKSENGSVDRALIIALGGRYDANGNYSIDSAILYQNLMKLDTNGDGKVSQDEIDAYKQTDEYKKAAYDVMMKEMENDNNKFDGKFELDTMMDFVNNEATPEQKEFFSIITGISDKKLREYIFKAIGDGDSKITIEEFTKMIDCDGDGIVSKEELQKFVDFVTQFYNSDKSAKTDRKLSREEAMKIEPFKSNPDLWYNFKLDNDCVKLSDVWNYIKSDNNEIDPNKDGTITVGEIAASMSNSELAGIFKTADGSVDRALIIALGGSYDAKGNYTINSKTLSENIKALDKDGDGKISDEELEAYKQTDAYKKVAYDVMMKEMENDKNKYDGKFTLDTMMDFVNNEATSEQKEFFSIITGISDKKLREYIFKAIGGGDSKITIEEFTKMVDCDGDGIVTKEELQKFVDFAKTFYSIDDDRKISRKEANKIEPFKSNPDLWYAINPNDDKYVSFEDVWNLVKNS